MLRVLEYGPDRGPAFRPVAPAALAAIVAASAEAPLLWIDADGATAEEVAALSAALDWHPLLAEDIEHRGQRQKAEQFPGQVLAVVRIAGSTDVDRELAIVQAERVVVTSHVGEATWIEARAAEACRRADLVAHRAAGATATILAAVVESYEDVIDALEEIVERQEADALVADGDPEPALRRAARARTSVADVRRASGRLREVIGLFVRRELLDTVRSSELDLELRDVLDHAVRAHEDLDMLHDRMSALADTRLAMVAYRQNEITKKLSAWAAILIIPAIVTGWFGQNFHHLAGLGYRWGELLSLVAMAIACGGAFVLLRRARWL